jgi:Ser/Thr protein kinase RdoA (MazF antagonist)
MPSAYSSRSPSDDAARQILRGYPDSHHPRQLTSLASAGGFSGATLWRVAAAQGEFCLRAMPGTTVNPARLRGLHRLLAHVHAAGVTQVAVPVFRTDGATFADHDGRIWQLEPWMPGQADFANDPTPERLESAMRTLARWHAAARAFVPSREELPWFQVVRCAPSPGIIERQNLLARYDTSWRLRVGEALARDNWAEFATVARRVLDSLERLAPRLAEDLALGSKVQVPLQPCLRDVWHDHVLYTGDEVTGLIDAHACRCESVAADLARLLGSLVGDDVPARDLALAAYDAVRPLSLAERGLFEILDRTAIPLSGCTWLERRYFEPFPFERPAAIVKRLEAIVRRAELLDKTPFVG